MFLLGGAAACLAVAPVSIFTTAAAQGSDAAEEWIEPESDDSEMGAEGEMSADANDVDNEFDVESVEEEDALVTDDEQAADAPAMSDSEGDDQAGGTQSPEAATGDDAEDQPIPLSADDGGSRNSDGPPQ